MSDHCKTCGGIILPASDREEHELCAKIRSELAIFISSTVEELKREAQINKVCGSEEWTDLLIRAVKEIEKLQKDRAELLKTFSHTHVNSHCFDICDQCGLDLRHPIHLRKPINETGTPGTRTEGMIREPGGEWKQPTPSPPLQNKVEFMNEKHSTERPDVNESKTPTVGLPHFYAYSHETPPRKLWDEDDMRDYAAAVLKEANDLCRSAMQIALRDGKETNWPAFRERLEASLKRQHAIMYPPNAEVREPRNPQPSGRKER